VLASMSVLITVSLLIDQGGRRFMLIPKQRPWVRIKLIVVLMKM